MREQSQQLSLVFTYFVTSGVGMYSVSGKLEFKAKLAFCRFLFQFTAKKGDSEGVLGSPPPPLAL